MIFRQLFDRESCTYTYVLGCEKTREAALIDPVLELVERDVQMLDELNLDLKYAVNTHVHADHIFGNKAIKKILPEVKSVLGEEGNEEAMADIRLSEGDVLEVGETIKIEFLSTPGHTNGCHSLVVRDGPTTMVFTGDTLLVRGCGRTDFQQGNSKSLYKNVHEKIFTLPDDTIIYPAHDYKGRTMSTVAEEKQYNPRLTKSLDEFVDLMDNLGLPYPAKIDVSLPANLVCGLHDVPPGAK
ncbi:Hydroxyacylglutathione hydrolase, mitochondrial [Hondaea fermentalgiana]|uniref:persulfide dioxygenase n=1 Tax=Hondaea fermentalgiana TaxID=2315210 RepID=A0A2R5GIL3_9STRA|nr:Hydroxyacylglutathione hydrolase, mitochondrial [Hondaea fermentalgiana]|eukprot:GBG29568.1 Hydroxyacylglutathione hydrolase, mitochondrial [Hondaea fermentalgiana]